jgi:hypothetical protein
MSTRTSLRPKSAEKTVEKKTPIAERRRGAAWRGAARRGAGGDPGARPEQGGGGRERRAGAPRPGAGVI